MQWPAVRRAARHPRAADNDDIKKWHVRVNSISPTNDLPPEVTCETLVDIPSTFIYYVSAGHTTADRSARRSRTRASRLGCGGRACTGELRGTLRTGYTQSITMAFASVEQPNPRSPMTTRAPEPVPRPREQAALARLYREPQSVRRRGTVAEGNEWQSQVLCLCGEPYRATARCRTAKNTLDVEVHVHVLETAVGICACLDLCRLLKIQGR